MKKSLYSIQDKIQDTPPEVYQLTGSPDVLGNTELKSKWEFTFLWVRKDEFSQDAYCTVCNLTLAPKHSSLRVHDECKKHKNNLESGSSYAKLEASPAVAKAKFRYVIY